MKSSSKHYPGIQMLRAIAAILVLIQHSIYFSCVAKGVPYTDILKIDLGAIGVFLFFCISGFVIGTIRNQPTLEFISRRALRIYPAFWVAWFLSSLLTGWISATPFNWSVALLIPRTIYPHVDVPIWTLVWEIFFYVLTACIFAFKFSDRTITALIFGWIIGIILFTGYIQGSDYWLPGIKIPIAQYNVFFAFGLLCAIHLKWLQRQSLAIVLGVSVISFAIVRITPPLPNISHAVFMAIGICGLLIAMLGVSKIWQPTRLLGNCSYGIYLLHFSVVIAVSTALKGYGLSLTSLIIITLLAGGLAGTAYGYVEFKAHALVTKRIFTRRVPVDHSGASTTEGSAPTAAILEITSSSSA